MSYPCEGFLPREKTAAVVRYPISPQRWWPAFIIAVAGKLVLLLLLLLEHGVPLSGPWYAMSGDSPDYVGPVDSWFNGTGYTPDHRMPGYSAVYFVLRILMTSAAALQVLVICQVLASAATVVLLARLAYRFNKEMRVFRWVFWLALVATFSSFYDRFILTESFAAFALIAAVHGVASHRHDHRGPLVLCALALTWLVFLKPVFVLLFPLFALYVWLNADGGTRRQRITSVVILGMPFLVTDGAWAIRNHHVHGVVQPLSPVITPALARDIHYPLIGLMQAYGCSIVWWDTSAEIRWFNLRAGGSAAPGPYDRRSPLPAYTRTKGCPTDTLVLIASDVERFYATADPSAREILLGSVSGRCDRCVGAFRTERPFHYQVTARLHLLKLILFNSGTSALMSRPVAQLGLVEKGAKAFYTFLYLGCMLLGTLGAIRILLSTGRPRAWTVVPAILLYGVLIFPFGMRLSDVRYLTTVYPLALLFTVDLMVYVVDRWRRRSQTIA